MSKTREIRTLATRVQAAHEERGVRFRLAAQPVGVHRVDGRVAGVRIASGDVEPADAVLVAVGSLANDELAVAAGIDADDGVIVNGGGRTSAHHVWAVGDVARRTRDDGGRGMRRESWRPAIQHAERVAATMFGEMPGPEPVSWTWSDQYERSLQLAGEWSPDDVEEG